MVNRRVGRGAEATNPISFSEIVSRIKLSPTEFLELNATNAPPLSSTSRNLYKHVSTLFSIARDLYTGAYEEAAWYPLVRMVLVGPSTNSQSFISLGVDCQVSVLLRVDVLRSAMELVERVEVRTPLQAANCRGFVDPGISEQITTTLLMC